MLRHKSDWRTMGFVMLCMASFIFQWNISVQSPAISTLLFGVTCLQAFQQAVIVHNCAHCAPFTTRTENELFFLVLGILSGAPVSLYVPGHNLSHHAHLETEEDVMRTTKMTYRNEAANLILFAPSIVGAIQKNDMHYMKLQYLDNTPLFWRFLRETLLAHILLLTLLYRDWNACLQVYLLPTLLGKYMIVSLNMLQHYRCDANSKFAHSRNFTGTILNYFFFNNGYHTVHHNAPGLHWSKTKKKHDEIKEFIPLELQQRCILRYIWRSHLSYLIW